MFSVNKRPTFEKDWKFLVDNDRETILSSIVDIPFQNGWLFLVVILTVDYKFYNSEDNYIISLSRTIGFVLLLISGATLRYQTLFQRDQNKTLDLMIKNVIEFERHIVYLKNTTPVALFGLQRTESSENTILDVQLYMLNSKFSIYTSAIAKYICEDLIDNMKDLAEEDKKSIRLIWSFPSCRNNWKYAIKEEKLLLLTRKYKDFSFMPFVHSYVEQYERQQFVETKKDQ